jgi:hypothetical protein
MQHQRVQAWIAGQYFPGTARRGVAFKNAGDVFAEALEHGLLGLASNQSSRTLAEALSSTDAKKALRRAFYREVTT